MPTVEWHRALGGSEDDYLFNGLHTEAGTSIAFGGSLSSDGHGIGNHGNTDVMAIGLSPEGQVLWHDMYGGTGWESCRDAVKCRDGGYAIIGTTNSADGDAEGPGFGLADVWILRLNEERDILWQKKYGGPYNDEGCAILETDDGGLVFTASIGSTLSGGDIESGIGGYWLVKLNYTGDIIWQNRFGGSSWDIPYSLTSTTDGGYIIAGYTWSDDGDVTGYHPGSLGDGWVVKVDGQGELQWQNALGGSGEDLLSYVAHTNDGGYIITGFTHSNDGDVSGNHGGADAWAVKLDTDGNLVWQRALGGSGNDQFNSVVATADGGFVLAGNTNSTDGDVSYSLGGHDGWMVKLDSLGNLQWDLPLGGSGTDFLACIIQTDDGGFLAGGYSESTDGHATGNHGGKDMWVVKLGPDPVGIPEHPAALPLAIFPNPAVDAVHLRYTLRRGGIARLEVLNATGQLALPPMEHRALPGSQTMEFDASPLAPGVYQLRLVTVEGIMTKSLVKLR